MSNSTKVEGSFLAYMLMDHLKSIGDPRLEDVEFINNRVDECCAAFERERRAGANVFEANETAMHVLMADL